MGDEQLHRLTTIEHAWPNLHPPTYDLIIPETSPRLYQCTCIFLTARQIESFPAGRVIGKGCSTDRILAENMAALEVIKIVYVSATSDLLSLPTYLYVSLDFLLGPPLQQSPLSVEGKPASVAQRLSFSLSRLLHGKDKKQQNAEPQPLQILRRDSQEQHVALEENSLNTIADRIKSESPSEGHLDPMIPTNEIHSPSMLLGLYNGYWSEPFYYNRLFSYLGALSIPSETVHFELTFSDSTSSPKSCKGGVVFLANGDETVQAKLDALGLGGGWGVMRGEVRDQPSLDAAEEAISKEVWREVGKWLERSSLNTVGRDASKMTKYVPIEAFEPRGRLKENGEVIETIQPTIEHESDEDGRILGMGRVGKATPPNQKVIHNVQVDNLHWTTTKQDLKQHFEFHAIPV